MLFVTVRLMVAAAVLVGVMLALRRSWRVLAGRWGHLAVAGVLTNSVLLMTAHYAMVHVGRGADRAGADTQSAAHGAAGVAAVGGARCGRCNGSGWCLGAAGVVLIVGWPRRAARCNCTACC